MAGPGEAAPSPASITCPRCGRTSYHPMDIAFGYCAGCNAYTTVGREAPSAARALDRAAEISAPAAGGTEGVSSPSPATDTGGDRVDDLIAAATQLAQVIADHAGVDVEQLSGVDVLTYLGLAGYRLVPDAHGLAVRAQKRAWHQRGQGIG